MVDEPDVAPIYRNELEARAPEIVAILDAELPPRFLHSRSFDYTIPGKMIFTGRESPGGMPITFEVKETKSDGPTVEHQLRKAITNYDRAL